MQFRLKKSCRQITLLILSGISLIVLIHIDHVLFFTRTVQNLPETETASISRPNSTTFSRNETCTPRRNIMALKVHKCASSTLQNILLRYGDSHNLTFVLPPTGHILGYPKPFQQDFIIPLPSRFGTNYNILCHHTRGHSKNIKKIMPTDTVYLAVIREPSAMYESVFHYFELETRYNASFLDFIKDPGRYYYGQKKIVLARNPMMYDFGLEIGDFEDSTVIEEKILEINGTFAFVLIADFMEESLVLLRELLCWDWEDVVVFHANSRLLRQRKDEITAEITELVSAWNWADYRLFRFFLREFKKRRIRYGLERLRKDVEILRNLTEKWKRACSDLNSDGIALQIDQHDSQVAFSVRAMCQQLGMREVDYTNLLRKKLYPGYSPALIE